MKAGTQTVVAVGIMLGVIALLIVGVLAMQKGADEPNLNDAVKSGSFNSQDPAIIGKTYRGQGVVRQDVLRSNSEFMDLIVHVNERSGFTMRWKHERGQAPKPGAQIDFRCQFIDFRQKTEAGHFGKIGPGYDAELLSWSNR